MVLFIMRPSKGDYLFLPITIELSMFFYDIHIDTWGPFVVQTIEG